jgi:hypothetical protein
MTQEGEDKVPARSTTPQDAGEWVRLGLGILCILHQLVWVSLGREAIVLVWTGGIALLTGFALKLAGRGGS